jgi:hypothetical protein
LLFVPGTRGCWAECGEFSPEMTEWLVTRRCLELKQRQSQEAFSFPHQERMADINQWLHNLVCATVSKIRTFCPSEARHFHNTWSSQPGTSEKLPQDWVIVMLLGVAESTPSGTQN